MKKILVNYIGIWIIILFLSGCWDRKELNDRAIWLATGYDVAENGGVEISGQIVIPANVQTQGGVGGAAQQGYFTISATGRNVQDALQNMHVKLPREAFFGQRRVILFSEEFARRGLKKELDSNQRGAEISFRADVFVVKGGTAKKALTQANPLEKSPAISALKEHRQSGGRGDTAYLKFLIAANREGIRPSIPAIEIANSIEGLKSGKENSPNPKVLRLAGVSVFNQNLKMLGFLNNEENRDLLWVLGLLKRMTISVTQGNGNASIQLTKINCNVEPSFSSNNRVSFTVKLKGEGALAENNSGLDMEYTNNLELLEKKFEIEVQKQVQRTISKVQKEYGMDIFGFGEVLHRNHPTKWKSLKKNWDQTFAKADISVKAAIKIKRIGMEGPSLLFKESEVKK
ncbi:Ger(x)C family spore germination protein [Neobacillus mesonae]|uniref:Ger(x)C family spore germination protein n=1 Tax=Neobacillus mesonae TaxID=1193713 RepID=UPI00204258CA|nr:Ger(x)C family spore germination protein [Neobacillus mesonae]MCM3570663.1 Ger(x)C family spore germination protein [Neobacillus mesonae]